MYSDFKVVMDYLYINVWLFSADSRMLTDAMIPVNQGTSSMLAAKTKVNNSKLAKRNLQREGFFEVWSHDHNLAINLVTIHSVVLCGLTVFKLVLLAALALAVSTHYWITTCEYYHGVTAETLRKRRSNKTQGLIFHAEILNTNK